MRAPKGIELNAPEFPPGLEWINVAFLRMDKQLGRPVPQLAAETLERLRILDVLALYGLSYDEADRDAERTQQHDPERAPTGGAAIQLAQTEITPRILRKEPIVLDFNGMRILTQSYLHSLLFEPLRLAWALRTPIYVANVEPAVRSVSSPGHTPGTRTPHHGVVTETDPEPFLLPLAGYTVAVTAARRKEELGALRVDARMRDARGGLEIEDETARHIGLACVSEHAPHQLPSADAVALLGAVPQHGVAVPDQAKRGDGDGERPRRRSRISWPER